MLSAASLRRTLPIAVIAAAALTPDGAALSQSPPLKTGISLVWLDFLAIGRDGRPVVDLKPDEVTLKLGGRARPLSAVNLIDVGAA